MDVTDLTPDTQSIEQDFAKTQQAIGGLQPPPFNFNEQAPQQDPSHDIVKSSMPLILLSALGGKLGKLSGTAMLGATNGILSGMRQGDQQARQDAWQQYQQHYDTYMKTYQQQRMLFDEYRKALGDRADKDLRALEFARKVTMDDHKVDQDAVKNWYMQQHATDQLSLAQQKLSAQMKEIDEKQRHDVATEDIARQKSGGAGGTGMGARSEVMFDRIVRAGNEAAQAAQNIMELPVTSDTGWFGSAQAGHTLTSAAKSTLANEVTPQDVQTYKTMIAGVRRNLAAIEASGLAPSGSLTEAMSAVEIQKGDTQMTKLRKMAELRQIVEKGLEVSLANPKVPPEQKQLVQNIIDQMKKAIPFTQHDITQLEASKNPRATVMDFAKQTGLGGGGGADVDALVRKYGGQ